MDVPFRDCEPPDWLQARFVPEFCRLRDKLKEIGILTDLDVETLAQYVVCRTQFVTALNAVTKAQREHADPDEIAKLVNTKTKLLRDCRDLGGDLGLTITSRAKLALAKVKADTDETDF